MRVGEDAGRDGRAPQAHAPEPAFGPDALPGHWARPRPTTRRARPGGAAGLERTAFVWLLLCSEISVLPIALAAGLGWARALLLSVAMLAITAAVLSLVVALLWRPWARRYPGQPRETDAVTRPFEFVHLGRVGGFNGCVEISLDPTWIHLDLMPPFNWFGASTMSLPRDRLEEVRRGGAFIERVKVALDGRHVTLPVWTMPRDGA